MNQTYITDGGYRFIQATDNDRANTHWVFLPGGPGLGSEYYSPLIALLDLPGSVWRCDFPGDGSNTVGSNTEFDKWAERLPLALATLDNVILVCHSFSSMFVLTVPEVEKHLSGLVLMDAAIDHHWRDGLAQRAKAHGIDDDEEYWTIRKATCDDASFKRAALAGWYYYMTPRVEKQALALLSQLPYNYNAFIWAQEQFHPTFKTKWVPETIPTLIFSGSEDMLTPIEFFKNDTRFQRDNIQLAEIAGGSHYPWMEEPEAVKRIYKTFCERL